jgi:hypothetical protein
MTSCNDDELVARLIRYADHNLGIAKLVGDELVRAAADRISMLTEQLKEARKCASCGEPMSADCPTCNRDWQS